MGISIAWMMRARLCYKRIPRRSATLKGLLASEFVVRYVYFFLGNCAEGMKPDEL